MNIARFNNLRIKTNLNNLNTIRITTTIIQAQKTSWRNLKTCRDKTVNTVETIKTTMVSPTILNMQTRNIDQMMAPMTTITLLKMTNKKQL